MSRMAERLGSFFLGVVVGFLLGCFGALVCR